MAAQARLLKPECGDITRVTSRLPCRLVTKIVRANLNDSIRVALAACRSLTRDGPGGAGRSTDIHIKFSADVCLCGLLRCLCKHGKGRRGRTF